VDSDLVVRAQRGDAVAFTALLDAVGGRLHAVAYSILRDREIAADAVQHALMDAWRDLPGLRDPARFEAWTYRLVVRACAEEARRLPRWLPLEPALDGVRGRADDPEAVVAQRDQLERGFRRLSVEQRAVVVLRHLMDLPPDQVALALGVPVGTIHSRLSRAMAALRAALDADDRPPTPPTPAVSGHLTVEVRR
jgi:RNA polymerase sigma-70 factor (ECF subfamily)